MELFDAKIKNNGAHRVVARVRATSKWHGQAASSWCEPVAFNLSLHLNNAQLLLSSVTKNSTFWRSQTFTWREWAETFDVWQADSAAGSVMTATVPDPGTFACCQAFETRLARSQVVVALSNAEQMNQMWVEWLVHSLTTDRWEKQGAMGRIGESVVWANASASSMWTGGWSCVHLQMS